jgi:hypothetical protein
VSSRAEVKTTIEGGPDCEYIRRGRQRGGGGEDNTDSGPVASNSKERARASAQKQKKKEGNTLIFDTMLSSTRRTAALNTSGGLTNKEAAVSCGCARQPCAGLTGKVVTC